MSERQRIADNVMNEKCKCGECRQARIMEKWRPITAIKDEKDRDIAIKKAIAQFVAEGISKQEALAGLDALREEAEEVEEAIGDAIATAYTGGGIKKVGLFEQGAALGLAITYLSGVEHYQVIDNDSWRTLIKGIEEFLQRKGK